MSKLIFSYSTLWRKANHWFFLFKIYSMTLQPSFFPLYRDFGFCFQDEIFYLSPQNVDNRYAKLPIFCCSSSWKYHLEKKKWISQLDVSRIEIKFRAKSYTTPPITHRTTRLLKNYTNFYFPVIPRWKGMPLPQAQSSESIQYS